MSVPSSAKLIATALTAVLLAGTAACGGEEKSDSPSASATGYPAVDGTPATGDAVKANGYRYKLPEGWKVITSQLKAAQPGIDTGARATTPVGPFMDNLNTITATNQVEGAVPTKAELTTVAAQLKSELTPVAPSVKQLSPVTVDGVTTLRQEGAASNDGTDFYVEQYWLVTKGSSFGFTFAFTEDTTAAARSKIVDSVMSSVSVTS